MVARNNVHNHGNDPNARFQYTVPWVRKRSQCKLHGTGVRVLGIRSGTPPFFPPSCEKQELARNATRWARRSARAQKKGERRSFGSKPKGPNATFIELALRFFPHPENVPDHVTLRWREGGCPRSGVTPHSFRSLWKNPNRPPTPFRVRSGHEHSIHLFESAYNRTGFFNIP